MTRAGLFERWPVHNTRPCTLDEIQGSDVWKDFQVVLLLVRNLYRNGRHLGSDTIKALQRWTDPITPVSLWVRSPNFYDMYCHCSDDVYQDMYDDLQSLGRALNDLDGGSLQGQRNPAHWKLEIHLRSTPVDFIASLHWRSCATDLRRHMSIEREDICSITKIVSRCSTANVNRVDGTVILLQLCDLIDGIHYLHDAMMPHGDLEIVSSHEVFRR